MENGNRLSTTLLSNRLLIFGGRKTAAYLNYLNILHLAKGFTEYTAVKYENMPPLPRGYHAALPVSDNRMLVSGGCSAIGALQDIHILNVDTVKQKQGEHSNTHSTLLMFGGSDCVGTFLNGTVEIPGDKRLDLKEIL